MIVKASVGRHETTMREWRTNATTGTVNNVNRPKKTE
jgi:hypothetical protein